MIDIKIFSCPARILFKNCVLILYGTDTEKNTHTQEH